MNRLNFRFLFPLVVLLVFGCKDKTPKVKDLNVVDLQITDFSIEKSDIPELKNVNFSIDHNYNKTKETGEIYNTDKVENGLDLNKIKLNITYSAEAVSSLEYSVGNSDFKAFDPKKDSIEIGVNRTIRIKLTPKDNSIAPNVYKIDIRQYDYKSGTIDYKSSEKNIDISSFTKVVQSGNSVDVYTYRNKNICTVIDKDMNASVKNVTGIPNTEKIKDVVYVDEKTAYAISDQGKVYVQNGRYSDFSHVSKLENIKAILGYINGTSVNVAMIQQKQSSDAKFIIYSDGNIKEGNDVPKDFATDRFFSINNSKEWVGDNIHLFAGYNSNSSVSKNCWYTTNGEDWLKTKQQGLPDDIDRYSITKYNGNLYYLVVTKDRKARLFVSSDNGYNWSETPEGLPKDISLSNDFITFAEGNNYYILVNKGGKALVYKGVLRILIDK